MDKLAYASEATVGAMLDVWREMRNRLLWNVPAQRGDAVDELVANLALRDHDTTCTDRGTVGKECAPPWWHKRLRKCLVALTAGGRTYAIDADAATMSSEEKHACCVGMVKMTPDEIRENTKGVAIETLHYLNDGLWLSPTVVS